MKNALLLACALLVLPGALSAQDASKESAEAKREDRLKTLEEQVRALAAEVEGLRGELKTARESAANASAARRRHRFLAGRLRTPSCSIRTSALSAIFSAPPGTTAFAPCEVWRCTNPSLVCRPSSIRTPEAISFCLSGSRA